MNERTEHHIDHRRLLRRFWQSASGFWSGRAAWHNWLLCVSLVAIVVAQLATQYALNFWNRDFFNALESRDGAALGRTAVLFFPLAMASTFLAIVSVWGRMTTQRKWRQFLTRHLIAEWLANGRYRFLGTLNGTDTPQNPEHRITEDARVATDAPIDLTLALVSSILTVVVFFDILASVGGSIDIHVLGTKITIPAYLVIGVVAYSTLITVAMLLIGRRLTSVVQDEVQGEAAFRAAANLLRVSGEGIVVGQSESQERRALWESFNNAIEQWRRLCWQHMRTTFVTHGNTLLAPIAGLILCMPKYLSGEITLGEVTQAAAAFMTVQGAFNWLVDNFQRMADWRSSANRVAALLIALDEVKLGEAPERGQS